jgi:hypothetical protein
LRIANEGWCLAFPLGHVCERVLACHENEVGHSFRERLEAGRRVVAQHIHMQAGIEGDDLNFDFLTFAGIIN